MKTSEISEATQRLRLRLVLEDSKYASYRAELDTAEGNKVWSQSELRPQETALGKEVVLSLRAKILASSDYIVTLRGATLSGDYDRVGTYHFRVIKK